MSRLLSVAALPALLMLSPVASAQSADPVLKAKPVAVPRPPAGRPTGGSPSSGRAAGKLLGGATAEAGTTLGVRYITDINTPVTLLAEGLTFACDPDPRDNPTPVTLCVAKTNAATVDLRAAYGATTPLTPIAPQVSGNQWRGACAGTTGTSCHIAMTGPQVVDIDYYAKP